MEREIKHHITQFATTLFAAARKVGGQWLGVRQHCLDIGQGHRADYLKRLPCKHFSLLIAVRGISTMDYEDEQAYLEFIDGQNDAVELLSPQSDSHYYLEGWHDTKRKLANGELCWVFEQQNQEPETDDDWEVF